MPRTPPDHSMSTESQRFSSDTGMYTHASTSEKRCRFSLVVEARKHATCQQIVVVMLPKVCQCDAVAVTHWSSELGPDRGEQDGADAALIDLELRAVEFR
jgi:hypothetical protein